MLLLALLKCRKLFTHFCFRVRFSIDFQMCAFVKLRRWRQVPIDIAWVLTITCVQIIVSRHNIVKYLTLLNFKEISVVCFFMSTFSCCIRSFVKVQITMLIIHAILLACCCLTFLNDCVVGTPYSQMCACISTCILCFRKLSDYGSEKSSFSNVKSSNCLEMFLKMHWFTTRESILSMISLSPSKFPMSRSRVTNSFYKSSFYGSFHPS